MSRTRRSTAALVTFLALAAPATAAAPPTWAAREIAAVTTAGIFSSSPTAFDPQGKLTQRALADAVSGLDELAAAPAQPGAITVLSTVAPGAVLAGPVWWEMSAKGDNVESVAFAVDGLELDEQWTAPYAFGGSAGGLDTRTLRDGRHQLTARVSLASGATATASWSVTVVNGTALPVPGATRPVKVPATVVREAATAEPTRVLYHATQPSQPVTIKQLDAALVAYLGLSGAARKLQSALSAAGLRPPAGTGTEVVARMLRLRPNHPAGQDDLEPLPLDAATRAEAAYSFAQALKLTEWSTRSVADAAEAFVVPALTAWQARILRTAVSYVGYPYVWGGTSPTASTQFGSTSRGGFDCSGFVWRVFKLTPYAGSGALASTLRGRTTYAMSGEVPGARRVLLAKLAPGDVMFFGRGPQSKPSEVSHMGIYLGNGWIVHSSGDGTTIAPFAGWYSETFAWARRPLAEAGLA